MRRLQRAGLDVGVTLTAAAQEFIQPLQFRCLTQAPVYHSLFSADQAQFAHLEPAQNARVFIVAPCTANTLAKHAHGLGDDLLGTQLLAFSGPVIHAPAMNPRIWDSFFVQRNIALLRSQGVIFVEPEHGNLACGESGTGRLADVEEIFLTTLKALTPQDLAGLRVLVNLGPTWEYLDPVRILTNRSSGIMGASIAMAAWLRGAEVTLVCGPTQALWLPRFFPPVNVQTAKEMHAACLDLAANMNIICLTAAVSDYSPVTSSPNKLKKQELGPSFSITLCSNPDILAEIGKQKRAGQILIGFAAETSDPGLEARRKLAEKNLDMILANRVDQQEIGFGSTHNQVAIFDRTGRAEIWPVLSKPEIGMRLFDWIVDAFATAIATT
jgi:phosphopantothenoylcysteine decarboxylase/phosphopantothenate--cysteine ligase